MEAKLAQLGRAKRNASLLLAGAAAVFVATMLLPESRWLLALRAVAEAAMVGGMADWFAVTALFKRIPTGIPFITAHTEVIPRSKDRIADNLAAFVKEKFLAPESLVALIRQNDPARYVARWLTDEANTRQLGQYVARAVEGALHMVEDARIEQLLRDGVREVLSGVDLTQSLAGVLETLTGKDRHERLLEQGIAKAMEWLERPATREWIAEQIVAWLKEDHPKKQKMLPTHWIGENAASVIAKAVHGRLDAIRANPQHEYRQQFDRAVHDFVTRLQQEPELRARGEQVKEYILRDAAFGTYVGGLWASMKQWLADDLRRPDSAFHRGVAGAGAWIGQQLAQDSGLRHALTLQMEEAARGLAPDFAEFLTLHIRDTIRNWDAHDMAQQIELNIGKDLQAIRINGTVVGGVIGLLLHLLTYVPGMFH
ncbi:DUF445 family protein [Ramlibacter sp. XY19]|uniref:DUF445 domain-containing protein n=1 Tax=Ramlibacter paludis TaxID=2908000 RepID=UPI0023DB91D9|nr:DUF445 family protein [Ramlibacter paludis]